MRLFLQNAIALAAVLVVLFPARVLADERTDRLEQYLQACVDVLHFNGTVLVKHQGQTLLSRGFGFANVEHQIPNSPQTSFPPLVWQTYDIDYTAAKYEGVKTVKNARISVKHNGVLIHDNVEIPMATTAAPVGEGPDAGPLYIQDHGNPVRYRNVWVVEKK